MQVISKPIYMKKIIPFVLASLILTACSGNEATSDVKNSINQPVQEEETLDPANSF